MPLASLAVFLLIVTGGVEVIGRHDHQGLLPDHHCPVCRVVDAPADSPLPSITPPICLPDLEHALPGAPCLVFNAPAVSIHRLRGPPSA